MATVIMTSTEGQCGVIRVKDLANHPPTSPAHMAIPCAQDVLVQAPLATLALGPQLGELLLQSPQLRHFPPVDRRLVRPAPLAHGQLVVRQPGLIG
jgi:hypothetical protein